MTGISSGVGLVPASGEEEGDEGGGEVTAECAAAIPDAEPSDPGGREPLPVNWVVAPSGLETFIVGFPFWRPLG